jgi:hypothetical protein
LPDFHVARDIDSTGSFFALDEIVKVLVLASASGKITFDLVFPLQFFLDVFYALGPKPPQGYHSLRTVSRHVSSMCDDFLKIGKSVGDAKTNDTMSSVDYIAKTVHAGATKDFIADHAERSFPHLYHGPFALISCHPLLCGIFISETVLEMRKFALVIYNISKIVQQIAHLYNAAKQQQYVQETWQDMEEEAQIEYIATAPGLGSRLCSATALPPVQ